MEPIGCASGITSKMHSKGKNRFRCQICDYDLCEECWLRQNDRSPGEVDIQSAKKAAEEAAAAKAAEEAKKAAEEAAAAKAAANKAAEAAAAKKSEPAEDQDASKVE